MKVRPLYDRVVVERVASEEKTAGGIYIPDTAKEKPLEGIVRAAGEGKFNETGARNPMSVKEGDRVLFGKFSGTEISLGGREHLILREDEILAIVEG